MQVKKYTYFTYKKTKTCAGKQIMKRMKRMKRIQMNVYAGK
jgi:hypothetical protein